MRLEEEPDAHYVTLMFSWYYSLMPAFVFAQMLRNRRHYWSIATEYSIQNTIHYSSPYSVCSIAISNPENPQRTSLPLETCRFVNNITKLATKAFFLRLPALTIQMLVPRIVSLSSRRQPHDTQQRVSRKAANKLFCSFSMYCNLLIWNIYTVIFLKSKKRREYCTVLWYNGIHIMNFYLDS